MTILPSIFDSICWNATQPNVRLSLDVPRLSPNTNTSPAGTVIGPQVPVSNSKALFVPSTKIVLFRASMVSLGKAAIRLIYVKWQPAIGRNVITSPQSNFSEFLDRFQLHFHALLKSKRTRLLGNHRPDSTYRQKAGFASTNWPWHDEFLKKSLFALGTAYPWPACKMKSFWSFLCTSPFRKSLPWRTLP